MRTIKLIGDDHAIYVALTSLLLTDRLTYAKPLVLIFGETADQARLVRDRLLDLMRVCRGTSLNAGFIDFHVKLRTLSAWPEYLAGVHAENLTVVMLGRPPRLLKEVVRGLMVSPNALYVQTRFCR